LLVDQDSTAPGTTRGSTGSEDMRWLVAGMHQTARDRLLPSARKCVDHNWSTICSLLMLTTSCSFIVSMSSSHSLVYRSFLLPHLAVHWQASLSLLAWLALSFTHLALVPEVDFLLMPSCSMILALDFGSWTQRSLALRRA
jgi:hypothetical protein